MEYMGISLQPGAAEPALQALAARARAGDKQAQLELGIRFEEGSGISRDLLQARALYAAAAKDSGGTRWIYTPPVASSAPSVQPYGGQDPKIAGKAEAKRRLARLSHETR
jgi:hypothetical protein